MRLGRDAGQIADDLVKHLAGYPDASVEVRLEISASRDEGIDEETVRTVLENAKVLKFEPADFEEG